MTTVAGEYRYRVTPPDGAAFNAKIVDRGDGVAAVMSDRDGHWATDPQLTVMDLLMPEQQFNEWDIRRVPATEET